MNQFGNGRVLAICPRCKKQVLDCTNCGESAIYGSKHLLCISCFDSEEDEINEKGTNNLPETLAYYGIQNDPSEDGPLGILFER